MCWLYGYMPHRGTTRRVLTSLRWAQQLRLRMYVRTSYQSLRPGHFRPGQTRFMLSHSSLPLVLPEPQADLTSMKQKVSVVLEKTQTDDRLIAALKAEVAQLRKGGAVGSAGPAGPRCATWQGWGTPPLHLHATLHALQQ